MTSTLQPQIDFLDETMRLYIDGAFVETEGSLPSINPATGETLGEGAARHRARGRRGGRRGGARVRRVAVHAADAARAPDVEARRPARGEQGRVRDDRGARQRQADVGGPGRRHRADDRAAALLRRVDDEDRRQGAAELDPRDVHDRQARARRASSRRSRRGTSRCSRSAYKLGPALAAGCTIVIKPSELAPLSTLRLMQLVDEAGFPPGVVNVVIGGPEVGARARSPSGRRRRSRSPVRPRRARRSCATAVDGLKRVTLELGGKSPNIVFADAEPRGGRERRVRRDLLQPGAGVRRGLPPVRRGAGRRRAGGAGRRAGGRDPLGARASIPRPRWGR